MKKIFISRRLNRNSVFNQVLTTQNLTVIGQGLIRFSAVPFTQLPTHDWLFFYSKNGIKYFEKGLKKTAIKIPSTSQWAGFGPSTAKYLQQVDFIGTGNAETTAKAFSSIAKGQKVLFIQAKNSQSSVQKILANHIQAQELVVYQNTARKKFEIPSCDILCFTSPLNAKAYFSKYAIKDHQTVISIGKTTATALTELGISKVVVADQASEQGLAQKVLELL